MAKLSSRIFGFLNHRWIRICITLILIVYIIALQRKIASVSEKETDRAFDPDLISETDISSGSLNIEQDNPSLISHILEKYLVLPSLREVDWKPVHVTDKKRQQQVSRYVMDLFKQKRGGTFIECGANDGEFYSNTQLLEQKYGWSGLLIEADPRPLKKLLARNRNAWVAKCCLSTDSQPKRMEFLRNDKAEGLSFIPGKLHFVGKEEDYYGFEAQCFPLFSILTAINMTIIDYFSADIEGAELDVLKTIPWDKVLIKVLSVEVHEKYIIPVREFMTNVAGYEYITYIHNGYSHDHIYAQKSILHELNLNSTVT